MHARTVAHAPDDRAVAGQRLGEIPAEYGVVDMRGRRRRFLGGGGDQGAVREKRVDAPEVGIGRLIVQQPGAHAGEGSPAAPCSDTSSARIAARSL